MNLQAKQNMSQNDLMILRSEMDKKEKVKALCGCYGFLQEELGVTVII
ncbi:hypothetical protein [Staphylococcus hyicus]|uniref:Uncharacterized protein n=1 Tax=Staphylococcus hyicus TaxID=1284 RepID=A0ACD5FN24_STAHY|nr:hypothetical protein [Staphylococcus hyicus]